MSDVCLLCGGTGCTREDKLESDFIRCKTYETSLYIGREFVEDYEGEEIFNKALNLMVEKIIREEKSPQNGYWVFYYAPNEIEPQKNPAYINLAPLLKNYPKTVTDIVNRTLLNLVTLWPNYGNNIICFNYWHRLFYINDSMSCSRVIGVANMMAEFGYLNHTEDESVFIISANGWKMAESLRKKSIDTKQAFIAMSFQEAARPIREAFRTAILESGYAVSIIDEKEHNNQIVPEIFHEIEKSKFIVVDVTYPNHGAYYEAGYAQGLGKEVIVCCHKDVFSSTENKPHFDISQKSMIVWDTHEDLVKRLKKPIEATVK